MKKKAILDWVYIILGSFLLSAGFVLFITPYSITPGGVYGIGIVLNHLFPYFPVGTYGLCMDIPLLLISLRVFGAKLGAKTLVSALSIPLIMNGLTWLVGGMGADWKEAGIDPTRILSGAINLSDDVLLACLFGGVFIGTALSLILRTGATSGGTDIVAMIITKYMKFPIGRSILIVDSCVVLLGLIVFGDWKIPLYSLVTLFVMTKMLDFWLEGGADDKLLFIISEKRDMVRDFVINDLERGGTYIRSAGMYNEDEKDMIFLVVSRRQLPLIQNYIKEIDSKAFMIVVNAHETLGDGFKPFESKMTL